jgi:uncharacterized ferritin-like protein (DUF455 family)
LANIEQWAIDLSWDIICRFGPNQEYPDKSKLPNDFYTDFIKVACDEAKHVSLSYLFGFISFIELFKM